MDFSPLYLATGGTISALILLVGHYFPWHKILPGGQPLNRLWSYRYGSTACWIGFTYWRYFGLGDYVSPAGLMIIYLAAGLTVGTAYWLDAKGQEKTTTNRRRQSDEYPILTKDESVNDLRFKR